MLAIAKARPTNLAQLADSSFIANALPPKKLNGDDQVAETNEEAEDSTSEECVKPVASAQLAEADVQVDFISQMTSSFWKMYKQRPFSPVIAPVAPEGLC